MQATFCYSDNHEGDMNIGEPGRRNKYISKKAGAVDLNICEYKTDNRYQMYQAGEQ